MGLGTSQSGKQTEKQPVAPTHPETLSADAPPGGVTAKTLTMVDPDGQADADPKPDAFSQLDEAAHDPEEPARPDGQLGTSSPPDVPAPPDIAAHDQGEPVTRMRQRTKRPRLHAPVAMVDELISEVASLRQKMHVAVNEDNCAEAQSCKTMIASCKARLRDADC